MYLKLVCRLDFVVTITLVSFPRWFSDVLDVLMNNWISMLLLHYIYFQDDLEMMMGI